MTKRYLHVDTEGVPHVTSHPVPPFTDSAKIAPVHAPVPDIQMNIDTKKMSLFHPMHNLLFPDKVHVSSI